MTNSLAIVAEMALVTWLVLLVASLLRAKAWTPSGLWAALGNREGMPPPHGLAARTDRAAKNMLEALVLFSALVLAAAAGGVDSPQVELGARLFFWARLVYLPVYMIGIPVLRTLVWCASVVGMGMIFRAIVQALPPGA